MAHKKSRRRKTEDQDTYLSIRVAHYEAVAEAAVNLYAYHPQIAFDLDDRDPLYRFVTELTISGTAVHPKKRAGELFDLAIYGDDAPSRFLDATLGDPQARDETGVLQYRTYRGETIPVYKPSLGMGLLRKVRGEARWTALVNVIPRIVTDMLIVLGTGRDLFMTLHERKDAKSRWVRRLSLQTSGTAEEDAE